MSITDASPVRRRRGRGARERILKAATDLFTAQGINATGMEQLTTAAEVSKRTLYQHFSGKDELVHACLREMEDGLLPPQVPPEMTAQDARELLLAVLSWPLRSPRRRCAAARSSTPRSRSPTPSTRSTASPRPSRPSSPGGW